MRTGLTKQEKTTDIWFDEKDPLNPYPHPQHRLKEAGLTAYAGQLTPTSAARPTQTRTRAAWSLKSAKGRFSFRLTAPYSEERRNAASKAAKKHSGNLTHPIQKDVL